MYFTLVGLENLFEAWEEFKKGKRSKKDVQTFERYLEDNLFDLHRRLKNKTYKHGSYSSFYVQDPKQRHIHKAAVVDRIVHHLLYKYLYCLFDKNFIYDSYSCRLDRGTHRGMKRLVKFTRKISKNYTKPCWALKCDIKKFFASVDHDILKELLKRKIQDEDILWLLDQIIDSFNTSPLHWGSVTGIPLGNLTSQIFANIYLNELDQFIKHKLKVEYYLRYADDFIILANNKNNLFQYINILKNFLIKDLRLELHPRKIILRRLEWGVDFLGYIVLPNYILPRTKTKRRIFKKLKEKIDDPNFNQSFQSYLGYLKHARSYKVIKELNTQIWLYKS